MRCLNQDKCRLTIYMTVMCCNHSVCYLNATTITARREGEVERDIEGEGMDEEEAKLWPWFRTNTTKLNKYLEFKINKYTLFIKINTKIAKLKCD